MASILRQIVAGPRSRHPEAGLDLCYVTDEIIATSGPSSSYPQRAYRNPTDQLVRFLDYKHQDKWAIWEFRAEGTGYPDKEVHGRIWHYPWPDHHPPPFALIPSIMASMRNWLHEDKDRIVVVHCKAGKGRSGSMACSYLISECGWTPSDALARFTERRMRAGFGQGVSIPSQVRWVGYVDRWTKHKKLYVERKVEILELHVWGLKQGVKVAIEGYTNNGRTIETLHVFGKAERLAVDEAPKSTEELSNIASRNLARREKASTVNLDGESAAQVAEDVKHAKADERIKPVKSSHSLPLESHLGSKQFDISETTAQNNDGEQGGTAVTFRPSKPVITPTNDVNIDFERRNKATYGWTMVTSVAHVWFNTFFEGHGPEQGGKPDHSGVFELEWEKMDGIKGSLRKGTKAFDRIAVVWKLHSEQDITPGSRADSRPAVVQEPGPGQEVAQMPPADWKGNNPEASTKLHKDLGLRVESPASPGASKASSFRGSTASGETDQAPYPEMDQVDESTAPAPRTASTPSARDAKNGLDTADQTISSAESNSLSKPSPQSSQTLGEIIDDAGDMAASDRESDRKRG